MISTCTPCAGLATGTLGWGHFFSHVCKTKPSSPCHFFSRMVWLLKVFLCIFEEQPGVANEYRFSFFRRSLWLLTIRMVQTVFAILAARNWWRKSGKKKECGFGTGLCFLIAGNHLLRARVWCEVVLIWVTLENCQSSVDFEGSQDVGTP